VHFVSCLRRQPDLALPLSGIAVPIAFSASLLWTKMSTDATFFTFCYGSPLQAFPLHQLRSIFPHIFPPHFGRSRMQDSFVSRLFLLKVLTRGPRYYFRLPIFANRSLLFLPPPGRRQFSSQTSSVLQPKLSFRSSQWSQRLDRFFQMGSSSFRRLGRSHCAYPWPQVLLLRGDVSKDKLDVACPGFHVGQDFRFPPFPFDSRMARTNRAVLPPSPTSPPSEGATPPPTRQHGLAFLISKVAARHVLIFCPVPRGFPSLSFFPRRLIKRHCQIKVQ